MVYVHWVSKLLYIGVCQGTQGLAYLLAKENIMPTRALGENSTEVHLLKWTLEKEELIT